MQKKLQSLLSVACLVAAAAIIFIACGSGEIVEIAAKTQEINDSYDNLADNIKEGIEYEEPPPPLSSYEEEPSSSSPEIPGSSTEGPSSAVVPSSSSPIIPGSSAVNPSSATVPSSSSLRSSSSQAQSGSCPAGSAKSGFTCNWDASSSTLLSPGQIIKPVATGDAGCAITWRYKDSALNPNCYEVPEGGVTVVPGASYILIAGLDCGGEKYKTDCDPKTGLTAKAAPNLSGECKWDRSEVSEARGAMPDTGKVVKLTDVDKVCGNTLPPVVYKNGDTGNNWPANGVVSAGTYSNVQATVACGSYEVPPIICPTLNVVKGNAVIVTCIGSQVGACKPGNQDIIIPEGECMDIEYEWTGQAVTIGLTCSIQYQGTGLTLDVTYNGKTTSASGDYYITTPDKGITLGQFSGIGSFMGICVKSNKSDAEIKCRFSN